MADLHTKPDMGELAPVAQNASIAYTIDPFLKILLNQDQILATKGAGDFKIYKEVLRDDQVKSTFQQRRLSVVSKPWTVEAGADDSASQAAAEALKANLARISWDDITDKQLYALFYGYGVGEVMWGLSDGLVSINTIKIREPDRFRFNVDGHLFLQGADFQFKRMPDRKFWVVSTGADNSDNPYGVGLAHWLYWPVFFKRNDIKFWLIFLEKFGQPTALGELPAGEDQNSATRNKVLAALRAVATESAIAVPAGTKITLLEAARSGSADYATMKDAMDAAISKVVLSQTMTTDNGSSRSQSETHADVRDMVVRADADLICESFNNSVVKWWFEYNQAAFAGATPPRVYRNVEPPANLTETATRDELITKLGYEPTEDYIKETYGDGWIKKQSAPAPSAFGQQPPVDPQAANFAESMALELLKTAHRGDQIALANAAQRIASDYQGVIGDRVQQILDYAEAAGDFDTMEKRLRELMAELPAQQTVEKTERASLWSRLTGMLRGQR
jgi:phage gp29-like protein